MIQFVESALFWSCCEEGSALVLGVPKLVTMVTSRPALVIIIRQVGNGAFESDMAVIMTSATRATTTTPTASVGTPTRGLILGFVIDSCYASGICM